MDERIPRMPIDTDGGFRQAAGFELPIVAINLAHRPDRLAMLQQRCAAMGLDKVARAPAVVGADLTDADIAAFHAATSRDVDTAPTDHLMLTRPAIGCFLSHLAIWRWVVENNVPRLLVLEDDAAPRADFDADRFGAFVRGLGPAHDLVFPGCLIMAGLAEEPTGAALARLYYFNGTFCYLATPAACRWLLAHLLPMRAHVDHQMSHTFIANRDTFAAYYATPRFFEPDWNQRSDCYVPLTDETAADRELGRQIDQTRATLLGEGRPLLPVSAS